MKLTNDEERRVGAHGAGMTMAVQLRALAALPEEPSLVHRTHPGYTDLAPSYGL